ncbi:hypothetical protein CLM81_19760, partial [Streptomyces albidoflavus]
MSRLSATLRYRSLTTGRSVGMSSRHVTATTTARHRLWEEGPGSGPAAVQRGRLLLFAAPGTAQRLPALLRWEECGSAVPPLLCHGSGDAVTVPGPDPAGAPGTVVPALRAAVGHPRD